MNGHSRAALAQSLLLRASPDVDIDIHHLRLEQHTSGGPSPISFSRNSTNSSPISESSSHRLMGCSFPFLLRRSALRSAHDGSRLLCSSVSHTST